jgi:hypothetical protein
MLPTARKKRRLHNRPNKPKEASILARLFLYFLLKRSDLQNARLAVFVKPGSHPLQAVDAVLRLTGS